MEINFDEITGEAMLNDIRMNRVRSPKRKLMKRRGHLGNISLNGSEASNENNQDESSYDSQGEYEEVEEEDDDVDEGEPNLKCPKPVIAPRTPLQKNLIMELKNVQGVARKTEDIFSNKALTLTDDNTVHDPSTTTTVEPNFMIEFKKAQENREQKQKGNSSNVKFINGKPSQDSEEPTLESFLVEFKKAQQNRANKQKGNSDNAKFINGNPSQESEETVPESNFLTEFKKAQQNRENKQKGNSDNAKLVNGNPSQDSEQTVKESNFLMEFKKAQENREKKQKGSSGNAKFINSKPSQDSEEPTLESFLVEFKKAQQNRANKQKGNSDNAKFINGNPSQESEETVKKTNFLMEFKKAQENREKKQKGSSGNAKFINSKPSQDSEEPTLESFLVEFKKAQQNRANKQKGNSDNAKIINGNPSQESEETTLESRFLMDFKKAQELRKKKQEHLSINTALTDYNLVQTSSPETSYIPISDFEATNQTNSNETNKASEVVEEKPVVISRIATRPSLELINRKNHVPETVQKKHEDISGNGTVIDVPDEDLTSTETSPQTNFLLEFKKAQEIRKKKQEHLSPNTALTNHNLVHASSPETDYIPISDSEATNQTNSNETNKASEVVEEKPVVISAKPAIATRPSLELINRKDHAPETVQKKQEDISGNGTVTDVPDEDLTSTETSPQPNFLMEFKKAQDIRKKKQEHPSPNTALTDHNLVQASSPDADYIPISDSEATNQTNSNETNKASEVVEEKPVVISAKPAIATRPSLELINRKNHVPETVQKKHEDISGNGTVIDVPDEDLTSTETSPQTNFLLEFKKAQEIRKKKQEHLSPNTALTNHNLVHASSPETDYIPISDSEATNQTNSNETNKASEVVEEKPVVISAKPAIATRPSLELINRKNHVSETVQKKQEDISGNGTVTDVPDEDLTSTETSPQPNFLMEFKKAQDIRKKKQEHPSPNTALTDHNLVQASSPDADYIPISDSEATNQTNSNETNKASEVVEEKPVVISAKPAIATRPSLELINRKDHAPETVQKKQEDISGNRTVIDVPDEDLTSTETSPQPNFLMEFKKAQDIRKKKQEHPSPNTALTDHNLVQASSPEADYIPISDSEATNQTNSNETNKASEVVEEKPVVTSAKPAIATRPSLQHVNKKEHVSETVEMKQEVMSGSGTVTDVPDDDLTNTETSPQLNVLMDFQEVQMIYKNQEHLSLSTALKSQNPTRALSPEAGLEANLTAKVVEGKQEEISDDEAALIDNNLDQDLTGETNKELELLVELKKAQEISKKKRIDHYFSTPLTNQNPTQAFDIRERNSVVDVDKTQESHGKKQDTISDDDLLTFEQLFQDLVHESSPESNFFLEFNKIISSPEIGLDIYSNSTLELKQAQDIYVQKQEDTSGDLAPAVNNKFIPMIAPNLLEPIVLNHENSRKRHVINNSTSASSSANSLNQIDYNLISDSHLNNQRDRIPWERIFIFILFIIFIMWYYDE